MTTKLLTLCAAVLVAGLPLPSPGWSAVGEPVGDLGISTIECDCTYSSAQARWIFRSAPRVVAMAPWAPASGLQTGDVILSIAGHDLTSREGGRQFAHLAPGARVELEVRRQGRVRTVHTEVSGVSADDALIHRAPRVPRAPGAVRDQEVPRVPEPVWREVGMSPAVPGETPAPKRAPVPRALPTPGAPGRTAAPPAPDPAPTPREILPEGGFGFAIECFPCSGGRVEGAPDPVWEFGKPPRVYSIKPGSPAARAGLERGDALTHMDGLSLTSRAGGLRFGAVKPGEAIEWRVRRGGKTLAMTMVAEPREQVGAAEPAPAAAPRTVGTLRYAARFGDSEIEVRGSASVIISEDDDKGEIVITSDGVTVRVRKRAN